MKPLLILGYLILGCFLLGSYYPRPIYRVTPQHNDYEVGVTCANGGDPTVEGNFDGMLMVSCGKDAR